MGDKDRFVRNLLDGDGNVINVDASDPLLGNATRLQKFKIMEIDRDTIGFSDTLPQPRPYTLTYPFYFYVPIECSTPTDGVFDLLCIPVECDLVFSNAPVKGESDSTPDLPNDYRFLILRNALKDERNAGVVNYYKAAAAAFVFAAAARFEKNSRLRVEEPETFLLDVAAPIRDDKLSGILGRMFGFN